MVGRLTRWRHRLARWIDPDRMLPWPDTGAAEEDQASFHAALSEQFAVRVLTSTYQMGSYLDAVEADEPDPIRLEQLYRLDHAISRTRRQAENLLVLTGRPVQDADRQVTTLLDVIRASTSAVEHYARVHVGRVVDLAVVEFAADDLIRMLTELIDNGSRFSPPQSGVMVGAHMTESGSVLLRVEDSGFGIEPAQLSSINDALASPTPPADFIGGPGHLGFSVIHRLAIVHGLRVQLSNRLPGGITAAIVVPPRLLCEIPLDPVAARLGCRPAHPSTYGPVRTAPVRFVPGQRRPSTDPPDGQPHPDGPGLGSPTPAAVSPAGLPMRQPVSLRETRRRPGRSYRERAGTGRAGRTTPQTSPPASRMPGTPSTPPLRVPHDDDTQLAGRARPGHRTDTPRLRLAHRAVRRRGARGDAGR